MGLAARCALIRGRQGKLRQYFPNPQNDNFGIRDQRPGPLKFRLRGYDALNTVA